MVKDDELIADMQFNRVEDRVKAYMAMEKRVYEETGEHTLYTVNVSDSLPKMFETAKRRWRRGQRHHGQLHGGGTDGHAGAGGGRRGQRAHPRPHGLRRRPVQSHYSAMSSHLVLGKLPRLAGADMVVFPAPYGKAPLLQGPLPALRRTMTYPLHDLKPTMPMPSGGITPLMVPQCVADLGPDIMIGSGGGIHAHPMGPAAGAKAFRQAIDATMQGIPLKQYAKDHQELAVAMGIWTGAFQETKA